MTTDSKKRVVLIDDNPELLETLTGIFERSDDFTVTGSFQTAESCLEDLKNGSEQPELFLVDLGLPGMSGQVLIAELKKLFPTGDCVAHTVFEDSLSVFQALKAGADGYLLKGCTGPQLLNSLRILDTDGAPLTPRVAKLLMAEFQQDALSPLSAREGEVLVLLSEGHSYKSAAAKMIISVHTVHGHVKSIYEKLQVRNRRDAVTKAKRKGWLQ